jgi:hypothetical protein
MLSEPGQYLRAEESGPSRRAKQNDAMCGKRNDRTIDGKRAWGCGHD